MDARKSGVPNRRLPAVSPTRAQTGYSESVTFDRRCTVCGRSLSERSYGTKTCSDRCRQRLHRKVGRVQPALTRPSRTARNISVVAESLAPSSAAYPLSAAETHTTAESKCAWCGGPFTANAFGRPRTYCSIDCRMVAGHYRESAPTLHAAIAELEASERAYRRQRLRFPSAFRNELAQLRAFLPVQPQTTKPAKGVLEWT